MDKAASGGGEARFAAYVEALGRVIGHADRQEPMRDYCLGLLMPIARKRVEPRVAVTAPVAANMIRVKYALSAIASKYPRTAIECWGWTDSSVVQLALQVLSADMVY